MLICTTTTAAVVWYGRNTDPPRQTETPGFTPATRVHGDGHVEPRRRGAFPGQGIITLRAQVRAFAVYLTLSACWVDRDEPHRLDRARQSRRHIHVF